MRMAASSSQQETTMEREITLLSDSELDDVAGGVRDNPFQDAANQRTANFNKAQGTLGGSIGDPYVNGQPI
jgi:hypothetical protein